MTSLISQHTITHTHNHTGGCCDCGDPEAIDPKFFCCRHKPKSNDSDLTPEQQMRRRHMVSIFSYIGKCVLECSDAFERVRSVSHSSNSRVDVKIHNDDIHTFDEVITALQSVGIKNPELVAKKAHETGSVSLTRYLQTFDIGVILKAWKTLRQTHGLFCSLHEKSNTMSHMLEYVIEYLISREKKIVTFRRDIAAALIESISSFTVKTTLRDDSAPSPQSLKKLRVKDIKKRLDDLQVDYSKCVEKSELLSLLEATSTLKSDSDPKLERILNFVTKQIIKNDKIQPSLRREIYRSAMCSLEAMPQTMERARAVQALLRCSREYRPKDEVILLAFIRDSLSSDMYVSRFCCCCCCCCCFHS